MTNTNITAGYRSLYEVTGDIKDINTLLVPRAALAAPKVPASMLIDDLDELVRKHGATSYRNRADTQNPAYGFTQAGLLNLLAEVTREIRKQDETLECSGKRKFVSRTGWVESAMRVYLTAGDTEKEARECAEYLWGEADMDDLPDPIGAAMEDCEGRGAAQDAENEIDLLAEAAELCGRLESCLAAARAAQKGDHHDTD